MGTDKAQGEAGWFTGEKWMVATGLLGFALALMCGVWALIGGAEMPPDGNLWKAFSFNAALGIFMLSTAAISPLSGMGRKGRAFFRWSYIVLALYSYFLETVQNIRGVNPRFAENGSTFDIIAAGVFGLVALLLAGYYLLFAIQFFKRTTYEANPELVLGIRYAMVSIMVAFAGGISISMNGGRFIGAEGNLIWLHGMGFHAIQALPFIAWLAVGSALPAAFRRTLIHVSGIAFFLGLLAMGWQTLLGRPLLEWSALPLAAAACFILVTAAGARSLFAERQRRSDGKGISA
ncbi:hypothetical protein RB620_09965 [Paenibacillus sp. LHD-117]|uniref:hypothetical protein n=1 Tax=Paenibacillus sp. LHD-117 TaxID=3071412 RepID=UPI0027DFCC1E|nr:hypothetical protein [Paenibacillus sp. LHD-117]MDQ6419755.1 hypothetical protein [Paenibacillus sp. LHD-117]